MTQIPRWLPILAVALLAAADPQSREADEAACQREMLQWQAPADMHVLASSHAALEAYAACMEKRGHKLR